MSSQLSVKPKCGFNYGQIYTNLEATDKENFILSFLLNLIQAKRSMDLMTSSRENKFDEILVSNTQTFNYAFNSRSCMFVRKMIYSIKNLPASIGHGKSS